jgi:hypothetical protein
VGLGLGVRGFMVRMGLGWPPPDNFLAGATLTAR